MPLAQSLLDVMTRHHVTLSTFRQPAVVAFRGLVASLDTCSAMTLLSWLVHIAPLPNIRAFVLDEGRRLLQAQLQLRGGGGGGIGAG